jgi:hypothetical protein
VSTLTDDEIARIKTECWDHVVDVGAEPYIGFHPVFNTVRDYVKSSDTPATSSSTAITGAGATTITVASATGLSVGIKIVLDVDGQRETCTIKSLSGNVVGINARKAHSGTYPVEIESPLTIVRGILFDLSKLEDTITTSLDSSGIKRADEVEFFGPNDGGNQATQLMRSQYALRMELARRIGLAEYAAQKAPSSGGFEVY